MAERAKLFNPHKQVPRIYRGEPIASSDTVYFSVTDQWGNAASFINSNYRGFGIAAVTKIAYLLCKIRVLGLSTGWRDKFT